MVVGDSLQAEVLDSDQDVAVLFYQPTCPACLEAVPAVEAVAQRLRGARRQLVVAKLDVTANGWPGADGAAAATYYPTMLLRAGAKGEPLMYGKEKLYILKPLARWLHAEATNSFDLPDLSRDAPLAEEVPMPEREVALDVDYSDHDEL